MSDRMGLVMDYEREKHLREEATCLAAALLMQSTLAPDWSAWTPIRAVKFIREILSGDRKGWRQQELDQLDACRKALKELYRVEWEAEQAAEQR